jgi:hypothetical protein
MARFLRDWFSVSFVSDVGGLIQGWRRKIHFFNPIKKNVAIP